MRDPNPVVAPVAGSRPLLSVMIPTYQPGPYLKETLAGILAQDPGPETMQIGLVDDASPTGDVAALIAGIAPRRIEIHRNPGNLGLAGNWNRSIGLARGEFVHLLHQDDLVLPGFYTRLLSGLARSPAGMAFCRHDFVDSAGRRTRRSHREQWHAGLLDHWLERISQRQRIQCPAAIVRRSAYEAVGGFRSDLAYALDWEMWVRIAARYSVWYEPRMLACYRRHERSETSRLSASGLTGPDVLDAIGVFAQHLPAQRRAHLTSRAYRRVVRSQLRNGAKLLRDGATDAARRQIAIARSALQQLPEGLIKRLRTRQLGRLETRCARLTRP